MTESLPRTGRRRRSVLVELKHSNSGALLDRSLDAIVGTLVDSEDLGPTIQAIFEGGKEKAFFEALNRFVVRKEQEIERLCSYHYQDFVRSVDELLTVRLDTLKLEEQITRMNSEIQSWGGAVVEQADRFVQLRHIRQNIIEAMEALNSAQLVLDQLQYATSLMDEGKLYHALCVVDQAQRVHLRRMPAHSFARHVEKRIPLLRNEIKARAADRFRDWLASMLDCSGAIGRAAMAPDDGTRECNAFEAAGASFTAVYSCLQVYDQLGARDEFRINYRDNRRLQAQLILTPPSGVQWDEQYVSYFEGICGFFLTEARVMQTTDGLLSRHALNALWEMAVVRIRAVLLEQVNHWEGANQFLNVKQVIMHAAQTLHALAQLNMEAIREFWEGLWERYLAVLEGEVDEMLQAVLSDEQYAPLLVSSQEEYDTLIAPYGLEMGNESEVSFPCSFPFSLTVPAVCGLISTLIDQMCAFAQDLRDMDLPLRRGLDQYIVRSVNEGLISMISPNEGVAVTLSQVVQISLNASGFSHACRWMEDYYIKVRGVHGRIKLAAARSSLEDTRRRAEDLVVQLILEKVDEFLALGSAVQWTPTEPHGQPRGYVVDLVAYLETTFAWLVYMPTNFQEELYFNVCHHITQQYLDLLCGDSVKRINVIALADLGRDLAVMEELADRAQVKYLKETFLPLRKIIDLFAAGLDPILDPQQREELYSQVDLSRLLIILEKFKEVSVSASLQKKSGIVPLKRRHVEQVAKKIKELLRGH